MLGRYPLENLVVKIHENNAINATKIGIKIKSILQKNFLFNSYTFLINF